MKQIIVLEEDCIAVYAEFGKDTKLCCKEGNFADMLSYAVIEFPEARIVDRRYNPVVIDWDLRLVTLCLIEE